jgi:translocation and assembly module TamA
MRRIILYTTAILFICCCFSATAISALTFTNKIIGLKDPALANAKSRLKISQDSLQGELTYQDIQQLFKQAPKEIQQAIEPYGYFKATVTKRLERQSQNSWIAYYYVNPGPQLHITRVNIQITGPGKNNPRIRKLLSKPLIKAGNVFTVDTYEDATDHLLRTAQNQGYLKATFTTNSVLIHSQKYTCVIKLVLNTGPRYYFGHISFSKSPLADSFLRRYAPFKPGSHFSFKKLMLFQQSLSGSGYFKHVSATAHKHNNTRKIPVHVNLQMHKNKAYKFGIGYGTNTGIRGVVGFNWRWLNRWGHSLRALVKLSKIDKNISAQYMIPGAKPSHEKYIITAGVYQLLPHRGSSFMQSIGVGYIRNYTKWQQTITLEYQHERYRFSDDESYRRARMLVPTLTFTRTDADKVVNTERGNRFSVFLRGAHTSLMSTTSFFQVDAQDKFIYTFWEDNRAVLRGELGYTAANNYDLPLSKQFYAGGIQSVRGFGYKYLGPGRYLIVGSAEYQRRVYKQVYGAIFYDTGNAIPHFHMKLERSVGVGVVWQSPVGALQLYVARAISKKGKPFRLQFSLGPDL